MIPISLVNLNLHASVLAQSLGIPAYSSASPYVHCCGDEYRKIFAADPINSDKRLALKMTSYIADGDDGDDGDEVLLS